MAIAMAMADQQSAWPKKRPLTPAYATRRCATTIVISNPTSHANAIIGPGCATQTAPPARRPDSQLTTIPTSSVAISDTKNASTPIVIDRGLVVRPYIVDGWWKDTGKLEDMLEANRLILDRIERRVDGSVDADSRVEGKVIVEAGAVVEHSVVRGPVIIGARAKIVHAYVGPFTSIMNDAEVRDSEIEHSIVLEGSSISNLSARIEDSLIGKNVRIYRLPVKPSAYRFMLGDNSEVGIRW